MQSKLCVLKVLVRLLFPPSIFRKKKERKLRSFNFSADQQLQFSPANFCHIVLCCYLKWVFASLAGRAITLLFAIPCLFFAHATFFGNFPPGLVDFSLLCHFPVSVKDGLRGREIRGRERKRKRLLSTGEMTGLRDESMVCQSSSFLSG